MRQRIEMTARQRLARLCLRLPDAIEVEAWGHPTFRVGKKTFAAFELIGGRPSIALHVGREQADILREDPRFFLTPYGRDEWISIWANGRVPWKIVESLLMESYRRLPKRSSTTAPSVR
jgi:predicted DNA-binding protein (MmcQ/YjbR family)